MTSAQIKKLFGTDGIRGKAHEFPLDTDTVEKIGHSLTVQLARDLGRPPALVIGRDTRESGEAIQSALARGALMAGATVESAGVIPTPGVAFLTKRLPFDAGVVISASHNPYYDNGIKVFSKTGKKLADEMERRIEQDLAAADFNPINARTSAGEQTSEGDIKEGRYSESYLNYLLDEVAGELRLDNFRIAIDCANGAASRFAPPLFDSLGAAVEVISCTPDGRNINENCGALHMAALQQLVREGGFDVGIAFDGDADRALFVDSNGNLVDGDFTLLLLADSLQARGKLKGNAVVSTVMSNIGLEIALRERGIELLRAQVGDRYVLEEMLRRDASLGGEQSGHIIIKDVSLAGDGMITAIELLRAIRNSGRSLADLASAMKTYPQVLVNVRVKSKPSLDSVPEVKASMDELEKEMQGRGRLLVRYSGTENLLRVMIEGEDQETIDRQAHRLAGVIQQVLG